MWKLAACVGDLLVWNALCEIKLVFARFVVGGQNGQSVHVVICPISGTDGVEIWGYGGIGTQL